MQLETDVDGVAVLIAHAMKGSLHEEEACHADVVLRIKKLLSKQKLEFLLWDFFLWSQ